MYNLPFYYNTTYSLYNPAFYVYPQQQITYPTFQQQQRVYPKVDPAIFMNSAKKSQDLLEDAQKVSNGVYHSHALSKQIMEAAQSSKTEQVKQLLASLALKNDSDIYYNPDGIVITLKPKDPRDNCCKVSLSLKWQNF